MASFTITPLTDHTGAEVVGLDFAQPIDTQSRTALGRAFAEHHVLVMRDQHFSAEQYKGAAQVFGELQQHDKKENHVPGHPDVYYISNDEIVNGKRIIPGETFHTDHSNHPRPPKATIRHPPASAYASRERPQGAVSQSGAHGIDHRYGGQGGAGADRRPDAARHP